MRISPSQANAGSSVLVLRLCLAGGFLLGALAPGASSQGTAPPVSAATEDLGQWRMGGGVYILASKGAPNQSLMAMLQSEGIRPSYLGGDLGYVYARLPQYRDDIHKSDTLILLNVRAEDLVLLREWPPSDLELLPMNLEDLAVYEPPFAYLAKGRDGRVRGLVVGRSDEEIETLVLAMAEGPVPVGSPWSAKRMVSVIPAEPASEPWYVTRSLMENGWFQASYLPPHEEDARLLLDWAEESLSEILEHFPDAADVVGEPVTFWIHGEGELEPGLAYAELDPPRLHFTAPSVGAREGGGYDRTWYVGNVAHEFSHVLFDRLRRKAGGYGTNPDRDGAPQWFQEGLGEYFRLLVIGEDAFERNYSARYGLEVGNLLEGPLESAGDVYAAGAWALRFLDTRYGLEGIRGILTSSEPTFWDAVREVTGLSRAQFERSFRDWLERSQRGT